MRVGGDERHGFDWSAAEARLNSYPQFPTQVDGQRIHFLHVQSPAADATPLLLVHGWPGSVVDFLSLIGLLTDPAAHGADPGWGSRRIAAAFAELMGRLGYDRYGAQGGDFGAFVAPDLGRVDPGHVIGVHVNAAIMGFIPMGEIPEADLATFSHVQKERAKRLANYLTEGNGYFQIQATRPQMLSYALTDSPVGQLAWIVAKSKEWTNAAHVLPDDAVDRDDVLTNVSLY